MIRLLITVFSSPRPACLHTSAQFTADSESVSVHLSFRLHSSCVTTSSQRSKNWRFHSSRFKSLIRSWILLMSSLSVAPKAIWNMYPVAAMWVTEGWTQRQTLEYLCSYDHQNQVLVKTRRCSLLCAFQIHETEDVDSWVESARLEIFIFSSSARSALMLL